MRHQLAVLRRQIDRPRITGTDRAFLATLHLRRVLTEYVDHYNRARPHRGLDLDVPAPSPVPPDRRRGTDVQRRHVLGGLIHEYHHAA